MLEVRPFEGTPEELSDFVAAQWQASYGGRMAVPRWSGAYFRWQLRMDEPEHRRYLIAAYEGTRLAGVVPFFPMQFSHAGERFGASQASWLSVSPDFRGQGVAGKMIEASRALHRELELRFQLGYAYYGHQSSKAPRFWKRTQASTTQTIRDAGFWVRVLDFRRSVEWNLSVFHRLMTTLFSPFSGTPRVPECPGVVIRAAEPRDLLPCLALTEMSTQHCSLRLVWDEESLSRQLGLHGFNQALVAEERGEVRGFITFYTMSMIGRTEATFGFLDLVCVSELSRTARRALLNSALVSMQSRGAIAVLKLRVGDYPRDLFLDPGWIYRPADSHVLVTWAGEPQTLPSLNRIHVLWR
jgi:GNAT superfamily N-acetyltransferase